ncbi:MAG: PA2169 family four-helix-bundle protein, partial [Gillisia sp.]
MKYSEEVAEKLNNLLTKNYDSEKGYKLASENAKSSRLKSFFDKKARERYDFGHQLKSEIADFGESPDKGSSLKADAHRGWMNIKSALSLETDEAILEEAVRGEKAAVDEYN